MQPRNHKKLLAAALLAAFALFLVWHRKAFQTGFLDEDFAWLAWARQASWSDFLIPSAGAYYRPFSVNLPFFLFTGSAAGVAVWRALALALTFLACALAGAGARLPGLTLLLLASPYLLFGLYYFNAFDYVVFPFLAAAYLACLRANRQGWALFLFLLAALTKELAILLPAWALLYPPKGRKPAIAFAVGTSLAAALFLALHFALSGEGKLAGFGIDLSALRIAEALGTILRMSAFGGSHHWWGWLWAAAFWAALAWLVGELIAARDGRGLGRAGLATLLAGAFLFPLALAENVDPYHHGALFFVLCAQAFVVAAPRLGNRAKARLIRATWILGTGAAALHFHHGSDAARSYAQRSEAYQRLVDASAIQLAPCTRWDRVVTSGLPELFGSNGHAEYALWALRWKYPGVRFYALAPHALEMEKVIRPHRSFWVSGEQAEGHPHLKLERDAHGSVLVTGNTARLCGKTN